MNMAGLGALPRDGGTCFRVWAPLERSLEVRVLSPAPRVIAMRPEGRGYHAARLEGIGQGATYLYRFSDGRERPDPASRFQPEGVHGPSMVVGGSFPWTDSSWRGMPLERMVIYELHVGTFSREGTFEAVVPALDELRDIGVTAIELMPVAQFPGGRNWGYDGVLPFAVQDSYGGPLGLNRLIDACHARGMAVVLDVVYNHLGPEGNHLAEFGPYFTDVYRTPWGRAINFDGPGTDEVRRYFIENALHWVEEHHVDALRLDAVHGILDRSAGPFLAELADTVREASGRLGRPIPLIAESDLNDPRLLHARDRGGCGLDAQWCDDFHHALHALLTGETQGYYRDFGTLAHMEKAFRDGFVLTGGYSEFRQRRHGSSSAAIDPRRMIVFAQNHDVVGNRLGGERLGRIASLEKAKLAAAAVLLSPYVPLLFMGEEYGEAAPFLYFTSHSDPALAEAVRRGRRAEFASFRWEGEIPDPQAEETFRRSTLDRSASRQGRGKMLFDLHRELLRIRAAIGGSRRNSLEVRADLAARTLWLRYLPDRAAIGLNFSGGEVPTRPPSLGRPARLALDTSGSLWGGPGGRAPSSIPAGDPPDVVMSPESAVVFA